MISHLKRNDKLFIAGLSAFIFIFTAVGWLLVGEAVFIFTSSLSVLFVLFTILEIYRRNNEFILEKTDASYQQVEAILSLYFTLKPNLPFPNTRAWAASPDLLKKISEIILTNKPDLVVEASSGVSTLIAAYCLKKIGKGKVISLDHESKYSQITRDMLTLHGLNDVATVIHAPLKDYKLNNEVWKWYDLDTLHIENNIDFLVIDGPPIATQTNARYPAIPLLHKYLGDESVILLDDGNRKSEQAVVKRWEEEFHDMKSEFFSFEKGAFKFTKISP